MNRGNSGSEIENLTVCRGLRNDGAKDRFFHILQSFLRPFNNCNLQRLGSRVNNCFYLRM